MILFVLGGRGECGLVVMADWVGMAGPRAAGAVPYCLQDGPQANSVAYCGPDSAHVFDILGLQNVSIKMRLKLASSS